MGRRYDRILVKKSAICGFTHGPHTPCGALGALNSGFNWYCEPHMIFAQKKERKVITNSVSLSFRVPFRRKYFCSALR